MLTGPGDVDEGDVGDGLVFVSYSHVDAVWAQRFGVMLKPLVRRRRLRVWDDTAIRATEEWHPAIARAIRRSRAALLLVSADFLASDYVMDVELPALLRHDVGLAPVLIGDCLWSEVPELAAVQWLHDIGRDGALSLLADNPGARDRWIRRACERLLAVAPQPVPAGPPLDGPPLVDGTLTRPPPAPGGPPLVDGTRTPPAPGGPPRGDGARPPAPGGPPRDEVPQPALRGAPRDGSPVPPVAAVPEGDVRGPLSRVPAPPPGYVVREELDDLVVAIAGTGGGGAVGVTAEPAGVGLHGLGGIGKSVLAAAVAADDRIRRRFPDGVYWVTVGERPDLLALQLDLLARLGARTEARTIPAATAALRAALLDRRALLVVDDVWSDDAALAFRVAGPRGRLLYTSRDPGVVDAAGAAAHRIGVLSPAAARSLAAEVLRTAADALPAEADRALAEVGHVPLAVALLAAAVKGGRSWAEVGLDLDRDADVYGTHPYADTFRALQIGAAALPDDLRAALFGLAVFPPDTAIPVAAVARYWAHTGGRSTDDTVGDLDRLAAANLLRRDGDAVGFHDLAHEYLLLHADGLPALHEQLLDAYRALLREPDQWWRLPLDEPYVWEHLALHLAAAGSRSSLVATVTDPAYQARRVARDGPQAGEADLAVAARVAPDDATVAWWRSWLARHAHLLTRAATGASANGHRVAATVLAWSQADPTRPPSIRPGRLAPLLTRPYLAVHGGLTVASTALVRVLTGHRYGVLALAWSPDGSRLASGGVDGKVRLWDPATGACVATLTGHTGAVRAVAWSPDGSRLATGGSDGTIRLRDPAGAVVATRTGHVGAVHAAAWSPDGTHFATGGEDGTVRLWSPTGDAATLAGDAGPVRAVAWSPDGTRLAVGDTHGRVRVLSPAGAVAAALTVDARCNDVAWSPDGARLAIAGDDGSTRLWDAAAGTTVVEHDGPVACVAWSPDGARLAAAGRSGAVELTSTAAGETVAALTGHTGWVNSTGWSPAGTHLATAGADGTVRLWDPAAGEAATRGGHTDSVEALAWSPDGVRLAVGTDRTVTITDRVTGGTTTVTDRTAGVDALAWSPAGHRLVVFAGTTVLVWDPVRKARTAPLATASSYYGAAAWSPDGTHLAVADFNATVQLRDGTTGARVVELGDPTDAVRALAWSPDGAVLVTAGKDRVVRLWRVTDRGRGGRTAAHVERTLAGHTGSVRAVAWSPDGGRLASTGSDRTLRLWDPVSGEAVTRVGTEHRMTVHTVVWSADGHHLATGDDQGLVIVWDRHGREVTSLVLQPSHRLAWGAPLLAVGQPGRPALLTLRDPAALGSS